MKTTLAVLALSLTFVTASFAKDSIALSIKANGTLTLKKVSESRFEKLSESVTGNTHLSLNLGGIQQSVANEETNNDTEKNYALEVTGRNIVRIIDAKENIDQEVRADINKSFMGKIKSISVDSKIMESLYAESMKRVGLSLFKDLNITEGTMDISSDIVTSNLNCNADGDLLICTQTQELNFTATGK